MHRKSNEHPAMDISSDGGMRNGNRKFLSVFLEIQFSISCKSLIQDMLKRHKCKAISVPLGALGAQSENLFSKCGALHFKYLLIYIYIQSMAPISADPNWILTICF